MTIFPISGIYTITNLLNNKIYLGYTTNFNNRKSNHFTNLKENKHPNVHLQKAYNKYGDKNFIFEILIECETEYLKSEEHYWATLLNVHNRRFGYNILPTGPNGATTHSQETIDKIQESRKWYKPSKETKNKMSSSKKGKLPKNIENFKHSALGRKRPSSERIKMSIRQKRPILQYSKEMIFIEEYLSAIDAAKELGIKHAININKCANNPTSASTKTAYGYIWRYKDSKTIRGTGPKKQEKPIMKDLLNY